jgi:hypothetical protein
MARPDVVRTDPLLPSYCLLLLDRQPYQDDLALAPETTDLPQESVDITNGEEDAGV